VVAGRERAVLRLTLRCDNACRFCAQAGLEGDPHEDARHASDPRDVLSELRAEHEEVTFVGGEPTLVDDLALLVAHARALGFRAIGVQTNGGALANASYRDALVAAGLTDVHLSIHAASAAAHDFHTDRPGSFDRALAAAEGLRRAGVPFVVSSVVTRSNARGLDGLAVRLCEMGAAAWTIVWPEIAGRAGAAFDRTIPRFGIAVPFVLHAVSSAMRRRLPVALAGFPRCTLGPFERLGLPARARGFAPVCDGCAARPGCPGAAPEYLARFGADELHAKDPSATASPLPAALMRMFVGTGPLATREHATAAPSPAAARASLPILGRPAPARAEVRGKPRRSGDALRELFPDLFDTPDAPDAPDAPEDPDDGATSPER
jgi:MoaA/NifB/PqqE/SkfB family radical SAM enzyme